MWLIVAGGAALDRRCVRGGGATRYGSSESSALPVPLGCVRAAGKGRGNCERQLGAEFDGMGGAALWPVCDARPGCVGRRRPGTGPGPSTGEIGALQLGCRQSSALHRAARPPHARKLEVDVSRCSAATASQRNAQPFLHQQPQQTAQLNCCTSNSLQLTRRRRRSARKLQPWCTSRSSSRI